MVPDKTPAPAEINVRSRNTNSAESASSILNAIIATTIATIIIVGNFFKRHTSFQ